MGPQASSWWRVQGVVGKNQARSSTQTSESSRDIFYPQSSTQTRVKLYIWFPWITSLHKQTFQTKRLSHWRVREIKLIIHLDSCDWLHTWWVKGTSLCICVCLRVCSFVYFYEGEPGKQAGDASLLTAAPLQVLGFVWGQTVPQIKAWWMINEGRQWILCFLMPWNNGKLVETGF